MTKARLNCTKLIKKKKKIELYQTYKKKKYWIVPSISKPIRSASVPVVGYLSFLASNSAIANDLIALLDHLISNTSKPSRSTSIQAKGSHY